MARKAQESDFTLDVEGVGKWRFARRNLGDAIRIKQRCVEIAGIAGQIDAELSWWANTVATVEVLMVASPPGWEGDLQEIDMFGGDDKIGQLIKVWEALLEKENTFRGVNGQARTAGGARDGGPGAVLVPTEVQPAAQ
jgi:hypothetical protein